ncbi:phosphatase PAP2 family protein [Flavobacterium sp. D11R37]|uniref:phosphatase PAP2 family protein n=1 Tax=Flavobacterium coralii TaxID=2838017 RepID=UPI001CA71EA8|nr:phosphatase PAP2 family protein [Flavobacterium coralii]MBY8963715.1 phosphatase PAP2 family protein [Flavobacterium coralii]
MNRYILKTITAGATLLFSVFSAAAQDTIRVADSISNKTTIWQRLKQDAFYMGGGVIHVYTGPLRWKKDDLATIGGFAAGSAILFASDRETSSFMRRQKEDMPETLNDIGWSMGSPGYNYAITGSVYLFGVITDNEKFRKTGVLLFSSAVTSGVMQTAIKNIAGRSRPDKERGPFHFSPFSSNAGDHSFPSGHAMLSFTTAYAIGKQFKNPWVKAGIYTVGLITPASRVWNGAHWLSDVGVGMGLSVLVVESIDKYLKAKETYTPDDKKKVSWNLTFGNESIGVVGTF